MKNYEIKKSNHLFKEFYYPDKQLYGYQIPKKGTKPYYITENQIKDFKIKIKSHPELCTLLKKIVDNDLNGRIFDQSLFNRAKNMFSEVTNLHPIKGNKKDNQLIDRAYFVFQAYRYYCYSRMEDRLNSKNTTPKACSTPIPVPVPVTNTIPQNTIVSVQSPSYITKVAMSYPDNIRKQLDMIAKKMYEDDLVRSWRTFSPMTVYRDFDGTGFTAGYKYAMLYALMNGDMKTFNECMKAKEREYNFSRLSQEMKEYVYSAVLDNINRNKSQLITAAENTYSESKGYHQSVMDNASDAYEKYVNLKPWEKGVVSTSGC